MLLRQLSQRTVIASKDKNSLAQVPPQMSAIHSQWRLELFFKSKDELESQLPFLKKHNITRLNITNKSQDDNLIQTAQLLQQAIPGLDLCIHYSIKYNYDRTADMTFSRFQQFCTQLQQTQQPSSSAPAAAAAAGSRAAAASADTLQQTANTQQASFHVLLVSGGGKKKRFDSIAALQQVQAQQSQRLLQPAQHRHTQPNEAPTKRQRLSVSSKQSADDANGSGKWPGIAVAFNPYLPAEHEAAVERQRLRAKLETGLVEKVYLQMGTDMGKLTDGLEYANSLFDELYNQAGRQRPQLLGSMFIPSKRLLAQMRFRPWNGVYLSQEYLSSVEAAEAITRDLLRSYVAAGVVPLVESAVKSDSELGYALELLSSCSEAGAC